MNKSIQNLYEISVMEDVFMWGHSDEEDFEKFKIAIQRDRRTLTWKINNNTLLHHCCWRRRPKFVEFLLNFKELNVNATDDEGKTPLHISCSLFDIEIIELLLKDDRVNPNKLSDNKYPPLYEATCYGDVKTLELFIVYVASLDVRDLDPFVISYEGDDEYDFDMNYEIKMETKTLLARYREDRGKVRLEIAEKLGKTQILANVTFCMLVLHCDGYLELKKEKDINSTEQEEKCKRFLLISKRLPMEIQKILCNRAMSSTKDGISSLQFQKALNEVKKYDF